MATANSTYITAIKRPGGLKIDFATDKFPVVKLSLKEIKMKCVTNEEGLKLSSSVLVGPRFGHQDVRRV